jgi:hypothetical protein
VGRRQLRQIAPTHFRPRSGLCLAGFQFCDSLPDLGFPGRLYSFTHLATEVENLGIRQRPYSSTDSDNACSSSLETSGVIWAMSASLGFVYRSPGLRSDAMTILPNRRQSPGHGNRGCLFTFAALNLKD